jgi:hypothetical protein
MWLGTHLCMILRRGFAHTNTCPCYLIWHKLWDTPLALLDSHPVLWMFQPAPWTLCLPNVIFMLPCGQSGLSVGFETNHISSSSATPGWFSMLHFLPSYLPCGNWCNERVLQRSMFWWMSCSALLQEGYVHYM